MPRAFILISEALLLVGVCTGCFVPPAADAQDGEASREYATSPCVSPEDAERTADQVLELINLERAKESLQPVAMSETLTKIAADYACHMVDGAFFGHRDPVTGHGPAERAVAGKYRFFAIGENLAAGPDTAAEVMKLWMESESHRAVILDPSWREVGIALRSGGEHGTYWVQEFGDPADF